MNYYFENRSFPIEVRHTKNLDCEAHLHEHIELAYIYNGSSHLIVDGKGYNLENGDFFFIFPNQIHIYENSEKLECLLAIFTPDIIPEFRDILTTRIPESSVIHAGGTSIEDIMTLLYKSRDIDSQEFRRGMMLSLCSIVFDSMTLKEIDMYNIDTLKNILIYIDRHFTEPITVDTVAAALHISRSRLAHIFREKFGTTFTNHITSKRINYACELLKGSDVSVTDAALQSGFGSVRTFNRAFINLVGKTPRDFRR
ncbi:MAG: AraC family transcriptional regulator [Clostridiales bacterium]|nr:AraC family transcriptional regulator [Clostridiales bacterium]